MTGWQQWLDHPEKSRGRNLIFQIHFWVGTMVALYIGVMSVSGSLIVYRDALFAHGWSVERIVDLHANLLTGSTGRAVNGLGAVSLVLLCLTGAVIWWPGTAHWRRSLTVEWGASFPRLMWDVHSALGFWSVAFVTMWGLSGVYLAFPDQFVAALFLSPASPIASWLADLHFGRFNWFTKAVWTALGLVPAILAFTGMFICCRRVFFGKPSSPRR